MLLSPSGIASTIAEALHPAYWSVVYQFPMACVAVYLAPMAQVEDRPSGMQLWKLIATIGGGGTVVFQVLVWVVPGFIGVLVAAAATYAVVMVAFERLLLVDLEHAHGVTSFVCGVTLLLWIIAGMAVIVACAL